jgi:Crinkler effector protein N-terminal domain
MTNDTRRDLWCFIKDDPNAFVVTAPIDASIARLKKLVWEEGKNGVLSNTDAKDLVLWKVSSEGLADSS